MRVVAFFFLVLFVSCTLFKPVSRKKFSFYKDNKYRHIAMQLPKGYKDEKIKLGNYGKEQFYNYPDGALFFIGLNTEWPSANQSRNLVPYVDSIVSMSGIYKGIDRDGLHWKEIFFDYFKVGYSFVMPNRLQEFEDAVNSIRFKNP